MISVGSYEAKTHLPRLLEEVAKGQTITITRHGVPIARLVPIQETLPKCSASDILESFRRLRRRVRPGAPSIRR